MKFREIKIALTEAKENYTVIVVYIDGQEYEIKNIKQEHLDATTFRDAILKMAKKKFPNKEFKQFYVVGSNGDKVDGAGFVLTTDGDPAPFAIPKPGADNEKPGEKIAKNDETGKDAAGDTVDDTADDADTADADTADAADGKPEINLPVTPGMTSFNVTLGGQSPEEKQKALQDKINGTLPSSTDTDGGSGTDAENKIAKALAKRLYDAARPREFGIKADIMGTNEAEILKVYKQFKTYEDYARVMIAYREEYDENWPTKLLRELSLATPDFNFTVADKQNFELISKELVRLGIPPLYPNRNSTVSYKDPDPEPITFDEPNGLDNEWNKLSKEGDPIAFYWEGKKYFLMPENNDGKFNASIVMSKYGTNSGDYDRRITPKGDLLNQINQEIERRKEAWSDKPNGIYTEEPIAYGQTGDGRIPLVIVIWEGERYYVDPSKPLEDGGYRGGQLMDGKVEFNDSATDPNLIKEIDKFVKSNPDKFEKQ
jgi:hypothetical protein